MLILNDIAQALEVVGLMLPFPRGYQQKAFFLFGLKSFFLYLQSHLCLELASAIKPLLFLWSLTQTQPENFSL